MDDAPLPDGLGLFHARLRLRFPDLPVRYDGPMDEDSYIIAILAADRSPLADIDYDPRRERPFAWNERTTTNTEELLNWIGELLTTPASP